MFHWVFLLFFLQSNLQPGLKLLLEGKAAPSPSTLKVERELGGEGSAIQLSPTGSLRHSRHSTGRRSIKRQMDEVCGCMIHCVYI